mgnify:CR=1 FL=1
MMDVPKSNLHETDSGDFWKFEIEAMLESCDGKYDSRDFLDCIWEHSMFSFDIAREIQVIIDSRGNAYCSVGTPSFVSFEGQEEELTRGQRMKLPIKCWIHTHPFGEAYFSGTDQNTINTWKLHLQDAIVIGNKQIARINLLEEYSQYTHYDIFMEEEEE